MLAFAGDSAKETAMDTEPGTMTPGELRLQCRAGAFDGPTSGYAKGYVQANMVILPAADAAGFEAYCARNPRPCPILEILAPGDSEPRQIARGADIRTDLPRYRVFRDGRAVDEPTDISALWRDDLVSFLLGCSFIAEDALMQAGLALPHIAETGFVPMYRTNVATVAAAGFAGPLVVSMRPFTPDQALRAAEVTRHYPMAHGAPIHQGDPAALGIADIARPDYGRPVTIEAGQIPVFWACGVTPQEAIANARPSLAITHAPGHMFVADITAEATRV
jgi:uncharacterized protein YcsI (UPF0317 family)